MPSALQARALILARWPATWFSQAEPKAERLGWMALTVSLLTGSTFMAFAKQLSPFLSPLTLVFVNQALIAFFTLFTFGLIPSMRRLFRTVRSEGPALLAVALLGGALGPILAFSGLMQTTAVNATLFGRLQLLCMMLLSFVFLNERPSRRHGVSMMFVLFGILLVALEGFTVTHFSLHAGDALIMLSCLVYAIASIIFRLHLQHVPIQTVIFSRSLAGLTCFFLLSPFLELNLAQEIHAFPLSAASVVIGMCLIGQFASLFSFYEAMERLPVSRVSMFLSLEIITATLFAHWYLGETLAWYHVAGGVCIMLGTLWMELRGAHATEEHLEQHVVQQKAAVS